MSGWPRSGKYNQITNEHIRAVDNKEVKSYIDGSFTIRKYDIYLSDKIKEFQENNPKTTLTQQNIQPFLRKTFVLDCGSYDGENIDLFDLQKWFDDNREWINSLKKECENEEA